MKRRSKTQPQTATKNLKSNQKQNRLNNSQYILNQITNIPEDEIETQIPDDLDDSQEFKINPNSSTDENKTYTSLQNVADNSEVVFVSIPEPVPITVEDEPTTEQFLRDLFEDSQPVSKNTTNDILLQIMSNTSTVISNTTSQTTKPTTTTPITITPITIIPITTISTTTISTSTIQTTTISTTTIPSTTILTTTIPTTKIPTILSATKASEFLANRERYVTSGSSSSNSSSSSDSSRFSSGSLSSISSLSDISDISLESAKKQLKKYHYKYLKAEKSKNRLKKKLKRFHKKNSFMQYTIDEAGDFIYENGIKITKLQDIYLKKIPDTDKGDRKYINTLLQIIFGTDVLKECSRTGRSRSGETTKQLDPTKNDFVQRMFWERIKHSKNAKARFSVYNQSVNRKIQNCKITAKKILKNNEQSVEAINNKSNMGVSSLSYKQLSDYKSEKKEKRKQAKQERKDKKKRKDKNMNRNGRSDIIL